MPLLGKAALAMWWDMAPEAKSDFEDWHAHEHFPERMGIPGFKRGTRWGNAAGGEGVFVMYELETWETLSSPHYLARLNSPTPWSTRLMPHHRNMVRSQCRVLESRGGGVARHAMTVRLSPEQGRDQELQAALAQVIGAIFMRPGIVGAHLLKHQAPAIAPTTEQVIRGSSDKFADWVFVACGYDLDVLQRLQGVEFAPERLVALGAMPAAVSSLYTVAYSATPGDVA